MTFYPFAATFNSTTPPLQWEIKVDAFGNLTMPDGMTPEQALVLCVYLFTNSEDRQNVGATTFNASPWLQLTGWRWIPSLMAGWAETPTEP